MKEYTQHEVGKILPQLDNDEYQSLKNDIKLNGQILPAWLYDGKILDGWHRYKACKELGLECKFEEYKGDSPIGFVFSSSIRRNLTASQKTGLSLKVLPMIEKECKENQGKRTDLTLAKNSLKSNDTGSLGKAAIKAGAMFNVNSRYVEEGKRFTEVDPTIPDKLIAGETTIAKLKYIETTTNDAKYLGITDKEDIDKLINKEVTLVELKRQKVREQAATQIPLSPTNKYRVIYADPPWSYNDSRNGLEGTTGATAHYPTMALNDICSLPVSEWIEDNAVLFIWATSPLLFQANDVIKSWGFTYKTSFVWDKIKHNMGHYNSVRHEFLLIATKGSCLPDAKELIDSVQSIERGEHSVKPKEFRDIIDKLYTHGKKLEMFGRIKVSGWDIYGNDNATLKAA